MLKKFMIILTVFTCIFIAAILCACGFSNVNTITPVTTSRITTVIKTVSSASDSSATTSADEIITETDNSADSLVTDNTEPFTETEQTALLTTPEITSESTAATEKATTPVVTTKVTVNTTKSTTPVITTLTTVNTTKVTTPVVTTETTAKTTKKTAATTKAPKTVTTNEAGYAIDISEYEKYINPTGDDWSDDYLVIMNASRPMPADYENSEEYEKLNKRVKVGSVKVGSVKYFQRYPNLMFNEVALKAFTALALEAHEYGIDNLDFQSAYRDYSTQKTIFNNNIAKTRKYVCQSCGYVHITKSSYTKCSKCGGKVIKVDITRDEAAAQVATYSCAPGTSEHQTGLSADINQPPKNTSLVQAFGKTDAGIWLEQNCYRFGFILRFPKDKENITGIVYEPWHFRFVGRDHATKMHELNMCLEEYIDYLESTGYFDHND